MKKYQILILISAAVLIIDQATKTAVMRSLALHQSLEVIGGFFSITYVRNPGAAFGIFSGSSAIYRAIFLAGVSIIALAVVFYAYARVAGNLLSRIALSLVAGGAAGNLIDRIRFGEVIDFLDVYIGRYHWPAFNAADSAITGGIILAFFFLKDGKSSRQAWIKL